MRLKSLFIVKYIFSYSMKLVGNIPLDVFKTTQNYYNNLFFFFSFNATESIKTSFYEFSHLEVS